MVRVGDRYYLHPCFMGKDEEKRTQVWPRKVVEIYPRFVLVQFSGGFRETYTAREIENAARVGKSK